MKNYVVGASRWKVIYNSCSTKVLKVHTKAVKCLYTMKKVNLGYRIVVTRISRKNLPEKKPKITREFKSKL